jgi:hypothetical protein
MRRYLTLVVLLAAAAAPAADSPEVPYPSGYRAWQHVKTMTINAGHPLYDAFGGTHHLYANAKALQGYRSAKKFPEGSVIVFDLLEAKSADNAVTEGERKVVGVMVKSSKRYATTGGWGFEGFKGNTRERVVGGNAAGACFACHTQVKDKDHVFSELRP